MWKLNKFSLFNLWMSIEVASRCVGVKIWCKGQENKDQYLNTVI